MKKIEKWLTENCERSEKFYDDEEKTAKNWYKTKFYIGDRMIGEVERNDFYLCCANMEVLIEEGKLDFSQYKKLRKMKEVKNYIKEINDIL